MIVTQKQRSVQNEAKRLRQIKSKFVFFEKQCACCGNYFKFETMWTVLRGSRNYIYTNDITRKFYYCEHCMPTAADVLHEIDTDEYLRGIAGIDIPMEYKKDETRRNNAIKKRIEQYPDEDVVTRIINDF